MTKDFSFTVWCDAESISSFIEILQKDKVIFDDHNIIQKGATPSDASFIVEIISVLSSFGLARIIITWLKQKSKRKVKFLLSDKSQEITADGYSVKDVEKLIDKASHISLSENKEETL